MKKLDANNGIPIPGLSNEDFAAALQGYNYFNDDQDQHDFMFLKMVPTIKIILSQIRDAVITQDRIDFLKDQSILHNPGNTNHVMDLGGILWLAFLRGVRAIPKL